MYKSFKYDGVLYLLTKVKFSQELKGYKLKNGRLNLIAINNTLDKKEQSLTLHRLIKDKDLNNIIKRA